MLPGVSGPESPKPMLREVEGIGFRAATTPADTTTENVNAHQNMNLHPIHDHGDSLWTHKNPKLTRLEERVRVFRYRHLPFQHSRR
jgi:hypothetical protein